MGANLLSSLSPVVLMIASVGLSAIAGFLIARVVYQTNPVIGQPEVMQIELARLRRRASAAEDQKAALRTEVERARRRLRRV